MWNSFSNNNFFVGHFLLFFCLSFSLVGCGYHWRGPMTLAPPLQKMYLQTSNPYGQLARNLRQYLKMSHVHLVTKPQDASTILALLSENTTEQLLGISGTQQTRQYNLILTVTFQVTDQHGRLLVPPQTVYETRALTLNSGQILSGSNQAESLYQQMRQAIIYAIVSQLAAENITALLIHPQPS
jgi:LPS-assembly lipoprotein